MLSPLSLHSCGSGEFRFGLGSPLAQACSFGGVGDWGEGVLSLAVRKVRLIIPFLEMIRQDEGLISFGGPEAVALETAKYPFLPLGLTWGLN